MFTWEARHVYQTNQAEGGCKAKDHFLVLETARHHPNCDSSCMRSPGYGKSQCAQRIQCVWRPKQRSLRDDGRTVWKYWCRLFQSRKEANCLECRDADFSGLSAAS